MTASLLWLAAFAAFVLAVHLATIALALLALSAKPAKARSDRPGISIVRPVCGLEHMLEQTLTSTFHITYPDYEIIFCITSPTDPAIPLVERLIAAHPGIKARLLIGDDKISGNPKLNNCAKGWHAARHDLILLSDSNVLLPHDTLTRLMDQWTPGTGLVSSPPIGMDPQGFWARLECAFLNTFQARWQMASAHLGNGYAQGKMLLWDKSVLEAAGGIATLGSDMAEDVASTKVTRAAGLHVRLPGRFFTQPIGPRTLHGVWGRQLRWSRVRRLGFPLLFLPEILAGAAFPTIALTLAIGPLWTLAFLLLWFGAEYLLARRAGWPHAPADIAAWALRDALLPALWLASWASSSFEWRGNVMTTEEIPPKPGA